MSASIQYNKTWISINEHQNTLPYALGLVLARLNPEQPSFLSQLFKQIANLTPHITLGNFKPKDCTLEIIIDHQDNLIWHETTMYTPKGYYNKFVTEPDQNARQAASAPPT